MSEELKPCPICGNLPVLQTWTTPHTVSCRMCGIRSFSIFAWNCRPIEDALRARVAELEAERDRLKAELKSTGYHHVTDLYEEERGDKVSENRPHSTHFDDCGCLSVRKDAEMIARLQMALQALEKEVTQLRARVAELEEHEKQTHDELGAILGTDDSLLEGAKRLKDERDRLREALEKILDTDPDDTGWFHDVAAAALAPEEEKP